MEKLDKDWLTQGWIDFEYKKYVLLAYLKSVKEKFQVPMLYPEFSDILFHYTNLHRIKENKRILYDGFPNELTGAELENLRLSYQKMVEDDDVMKELEDIITYALPQIKAALDYGKEIYEQIERNIEFSQVGLSPLYTAEGYLLLSQGNLRETVIYRYQLSIFNKANEHYRGIHTSYIDTMTRSISTTFENMKLELVKKYKDLPNPATYLVRTNYYYPIEETLLPITKRYLIRKVSP
jgi:hypothetical protein